MNKIEQDVQQYLESIGAEFTVLWIRSSDEPLQKGGEPWEHDKWMTSFTLRGKTISEAFHTGSGHRIKAKLPDDLRGAGENSIGVRNYRQRNPGTPVKPTAAAVMYSLLNDADTGESTFHAWCADCGYDTDSISARDTYFGCQRIHEKLHSVFTYAELQTLRKMLMDY